jgi:hypothetical protein
VGMDFYVFLFGNTEDRDLIFRLGPYFMGSRECSFPTGLSTLILKWKFPSPLYGLDYHTFPSFSREMSLLKSIGDKVGCYITHSEPKNNIFTCARICVEMDFEKGLPEMIQLNLEGWSHLQALDYEQVPFKCNSFHEYGHFAKSFPKSQEAQPSSNPTSQNNVEQDFQQVTRRHKKQRSRGTLPGNMP